MITHHSLPLMYSFKSSSFLSILQYNFSYMLCFFLTGRGGALDTLHGRRTQPRNNHKKSPMTLPKGEIEPMGPKQKPQTNLSQIMCKGISFPIHMLDKKFMCSSLNRTIKQRVSSNEWASKLDADERNCTTSRESDSMTT